MEQSGNEQEAGKKKVNEDLVVFMRKRSDHEVPRYTARLKTYVDIQRKRRRAATARRASEHSCADNKTTSPSALRKKSDEQKDKTENGTDNNNPDEEKQKNEHPHSDNDGRSQKSLPSHTSSQPRVSSGLLCNVMPSSSDSDNMSSAKQRGWFGRRGAEEKTTRRSMSRSRSDIDPSDACCKAHGRRMRKDSRRMKPADKQEDSVPSDFLGCLFRKLRRRKSCRRRRKKCGRRRRRRGCRRRRRRKRC